MRKDDCLVAMLLERTRKPERIVTGKIRSVTSFCYPWNVWAVSPEYAQPNCRPVALVQLVHSLILVCFWVGTTNRKDFV